MLVNRRKVLKGALAFLAVGSALISSGRAFSAWPKTAFDAKKQTNILNSLYGEGEVTSSSDIKIKVPNVAENGATVPVNISTDMDNVDSISLIVPGNRTPLAGTFQSGPRGLGYVSTRIKMSETGDVVAVVKSNGKLYSAKKKVKVTLGGCGG